MLLLRLHQDRPTSARSHATDNPLLAHARAPAAVPAAVFAQSTAKLIHSTKWATSWVLVLGISMSLGGDTRTTIVVQTRPNVASTVGSSRRREAVTSRCNTPGHRTRREWGTCSSASQSWAYGKCYFTYTWSRTIPRFLGPGFCFFRGPGAASASTSSSFQALHLFSHLTADFS